MAVDPPGTRILRSSTGASFAWRTRCSPNPSSADVDPYCGLSVDLEQLRADGIDPARHLMASYDGAIILAVQAFRDRQLLVGTDSILPTNPYHGAVWQTGAAWLTRGAKRAFLKQAA